MTDHGTPHDPSDADHLAARDTEHDIRAAFASLRSNTREVDTMAALGDLEGKNRWIIPAAIGSAVAALVLILSLVVLGGNDDPDQNVATIADNGDDADGQAPDDDRGDGVDVDLATRLEGTSWVLVEGTGPDGPIPLVEGWPVTMNVADGTVSGRAACNGYGGDVAIDDDGGFTVGELYTELAGCEPAVEDSNSAFLGALELVATVELDVGGSALVASGPDVDLRFEPAGAPPEAELVGTTWVLESLVIDDVTTPAEGRPARLRLDPDGTLTGGTGCRELSGEWTINGAEIRLPSFAAGGECRPALADQDGHVVTVLGDGFTADIADGRLVLASRGGLGLVYVAAGNGGGDAGDEPGPDRDGIVAEATTFADLACGETVASTSTPQQFAEGSRGDHVRRILTSESGSCRRAVFVLGTDLAGEPADAEIAGNPISLIEGELPGTTMTILTDELPDGFGIDFEAPDLLDTSVGVAALTQDEAGNLQLYVDHGGNASTVTLLDSPARVVVDTVIDPTTAPEPITGEVVLPRPIAPTTAGDTVVIGGLARPFEATGSVSLRRAPVDGNEPGSGVPVEALWSGFAVLGDDYEGSRYGYSTASIETWGEFAIGIDGLAPGTYEILFESFAPEESGSPGTYATFVVGAAPIVVEGEGLGVVDPDSGSTSRLPFGSPAGQVLDVLDGLLGSGERSPSSPECPNQADRTVIWSDTGLQIELRAGALIAWSLRPGSALTTLAGVGIGSTRAELEDAYVVELVDSTLGTEFATGTDPGAPDAIRGLLSGRGDRATITDLWAGEICAFR